MFKIFFFHCRELFVTFGHDHEEFRYENHMKRRKLMYKFRVFKKKHYSCNMSFFYIRGDFSYLVDPLLSSFLCTYLYVCVSFYLLLFYEQFVLVFYKSHMIRDNNTNHMIHLYWACRMSEWLVGWLMSGYSTFMVAAITMRFRAFVIGRRPAQFHRICMGT